MTKNWETLASSSQENRRRWIPAFCYHSFSGNCDQLKGRKMTFSHLVRLSPCEWRTGRSSLGNHPVTTRLSCCFLMFWRGIVTAIRSAHARLFLGHHLRLSPHLFLSFLLFFFNLPNTFSMREWEVGAQEKVECCNSNGSIFIWKPTLAATREGQLSGGR